MTADPSAVLGVDPQATAAEVTAAYRRRARVVHPDSGGTAAAFRHLQAAYEAVRDEDRRSGHDADLKASSSSPADGGQKAGHARRPPGPSSRDRAFQSTAADVAGARRARVDDRETSHGGSWPRGGGSWPHGVALDRIRWAAPFLLQSDAELRRQVRFKPGGRWWLVGLAMWAAQLSWAWLALWVGWDALSHGHPLLAVSWFVGVVIGSRYALLGVRQVLVVLFVPAWVGISLWGNQPQLHHRELTAVVWMLATIGVTSWSRHTNGRLVGLRKAKAFNVYGRPLWHSAQTGELALALSLIPAARVIHQPLVDGADHAVVLGERVVLIGQDRLADAVGPGYVARWWPATITADPHQAVIEMGEWLLDGQDPFLVDRRTLGGLVCLVV